MKKEPADAKPDLKSPPPPPQKVSFTAEELNKALMPPLMKMYNQASAPYDTPVHAPWVYKGQLIRDTRQIWQKCNRQY